MTLSTGHPWNRLSPVKAASCLAPSPARAAGIPGWVLHSQDHSFCLGPQSCLGTWAG